nr:Glycosyl hydrolase and Alpha-amylase domain containing protein [Haemonchus contortus]
MPTSIAFLWCLVALCASDSYNYYWYDKTQTLPNKQTMVHLFEWKWPDIAAECENFLQHYGYGAVQISPPNDHILLSQDNDMPWWVRYQPVSYKLASRSGNEAQFKDMVERCNKVGVRIIVDVVMNHMVGVGQKSGVNGRCSSAGSTFDGTDGVESFPDVPYTKSDFNDFRCHGDIQNSDYQNSAEHVKNCRLSGLLDLNQGDATVRSKLVAYLDQLIDYGVAGFRCDASKHMWPGDLGAILNATKNLRADIFGANQRPFVVHEVIDRGGEAVKCADYLGIGRYTNFNFGAAVSSAAKGQSDWKLLSNLGPGYQYGNNADHDVLNFIDNHDNQRDSNPYVVTYKDGDKYRLAVAYMLAWPYGYPRVMSSFYFTQHDQGPPNSGASNGYATTSPTFNSQDDTCNANSGWVCEHRWPTIREMAKFRSAVQGTAATEIFTDYQRIAFAREGKGFFALNGQSKVFSKFFQTTLPAGDYCDQYAGSLKNGKCTGQTITVNNDGTTSLQIGSNQAVAISLASRIGGAPPPAPVPTGYQKTVIFLKKDTNLGQNLFIRGGVSHANKDVCSPGPYQQTTDACAIPIVHNTTVPFVYAEYLSWSQGDQFLDFEGAEERQGTYDGTAPFGTPLAYSTNDPTAVEYQPYNKYGSGYWMAELLIDCKKTDNGWFELKGYLSPSVGWEQDISQKACTGAIGGTAPFSSRNHIAKCGAVNVFTWGSGSCIIDSV